MIPALSFFNAVVITVWVVALVNTGVGTTSLAWGAYDQALNLSGLLAITLMSLAMITATRPAWLESVVGGMDRVYRLHKWSAILAVSFAGAHWAVEEGDDLIKGLVGRAGRVPEESVGPWLAQLRDVGEELGEFAIFIVIAMVLLALWKRFPYHWWRWIHRAMPVLYLMVAFHAATLAPLTYWQQPVGLVLGTLLLAGSVSAALSLSGRIGQRRQSKGTIVEISRTTADVIEVVVKVEGAWPGHRAGQFAYLRFDRVEGAHPFTIASADHRDGLLRFQIKALGDFTRRLPQRLAVGQGLTVEGPYGRFLLDRRDRRARQVWIAGGIGVTPFIAWLEALRTGSGAEETISADLHYCTRDAGADAFVSRLRSLCDEVPGVSLHVHDTAQPGGRWSPSASSTWDKGSERVEVWYCGPRGLGQQIKAALVNTGGRQTRLHQEAFEMR